MDWFFKSEDQEHGPLSDSEFYELVSRGRIAPETLVRHEGMGEWTAYRNAPKSDSSGSASAPMEPSPRGSLLDPLEAPQPTPGADRGTVRRARPGAGELRYGGFLARVVGKVIDGVIMSFALAFVGFIVGMFVGAGMMSGDQALQEQAVATILIWYLVCMAVPIVYNGVFISRYGATPGKIAMGLKVVDSEGRDVTPGQAWGRALAEILTQMTVFIGYIIALFDKQKRTIHDHVSNTRVVRSV